MYNLQLAPLVSMAPPHPKIQPSMDHVVEKYLLLKDIHVCWPMQFKPFLVQGVKLHNNMYTNCRVN